MPIKRLMKRILVALILLLSATALHGQQNTTVRVFADQDGARFSVDGWYYSRPATFSWPIGSTHVISAALPVVLPNLNASNPESIPAICPDLPPISELTKQIDTTCTKIFAFSGWSESSGTRPVGALSQLVTADPAITYYKASFSATFRVRVAFGGNLNQPPSPPSCFGPRPADTSYAGTVSVNGTCYWNDIDLWLAPGSAIALNAFPYYGYAFLGFSVNGSPLSTLSSLTVNQPMYVSGQFAPGKRVRFHTDPTDLQLFIDGTPIPTIAPGSVEPTLDPASSLPGLFFWAEGSKHVLAAQSPQLDVFGNPWMFDSFTNGMGLNSIYTSKDINIPETITGRFVRAANYDVFTSPGGLKLNIDGRDNWPGHVFFWAIGSKHQISAPAEQIDSQGRRMRFKSWSNGGAAAQTVTVDQNAVDNSKRLIATYELMGRVTVQSSLPGMKAQIDGVECILPCVLDRAVGEKLSLSAGRLELSSVERVDFQGWADGGPVDRVITVQSTNPVVITANFRKSYLFRVASNPDLAADLRTDPSSPDGFYLENTFLSVTAEAKTGYRFRRWEGDATGVNPVATLSLSGPKFVRALLDTVQVLPEGNVKNAAGDTPDAVVAPGSLVAIFGAGLAPDYIVGPTSPLAQTIAGVTVGVADRLLPLLFVSPEQINAQLPSDLEEGEYQISIRRSGQSEITGKFTIARNAPGLFTQNLDSKTVVMASHQDGKPVSPSRPARKGEIIGLYGTGFGPYERKAPDGFALPTAPLYPLLDRLDLLVGERVIETSWSGAAAGYIGLAVTRFKVPEDLASGVSLDIRVRINGRESNTVSLPIE